MESTWPSKDSTLNDLLPTAGSCPTDIENCFELAYERNEFGINSSDPRSAP